MFRIRRFTYDPFQLVAANVKSAFAGSGPFQRNRISPAVELEAAAPKCRARYFSSSLNARSNNEHEEKWYDSHEVGTENTGPNIGKTNNWKSFKDVTVHPSILAHIEALGVGIRPRRDHRHKSKQKRRRKKTYMRGDVLDDAAERELFNKQRSGGGTNTAKYADDKNTNSSSHTSAWLPPLPFAGTFPGGHGKPNEEYRIERLPVKVLGSAASVDDAFPRSTKGLPEVALAGRSNVGKSTLLNALLYGNLPDEDGQPVKRRLGRRLNPQVTKMPRGKKAVVSSKPGETKAITLYQISSEVHISGESNEDDDNVRIRARPADKSKLSLVLADLPGYGFSYVTEERAKAWKELMQHYLLHRGKSLKRVLLLIDARHGMKSADFEFLDTLQEALKANVDAARLGKTAKVRDTLPPIQIVLTKCDLVKQKDLARRVVFAKQQLSDSLRREPSSLPVMLVSAKPGVGYNNVQGNKARGGVLELQRELAALVPKAAEAHKYIRK